MCFMALVSHKLRYLSTSLETAQIDRILLDVIKIEPKTKLETAQLLQLSDQVMDRLDTCELISTRRELELFISRLRSRL
jgi:hypothetical protein